MERKRREALSGICLGGYGDGCAFQQRRFEGEGVGGKKRMVTFGCVEFEMPMAHSDGEIWWAGGHTGLGQREEVLEVHRIAWEACTK